MFGLLVWKKNVWNGMELMFRSVVSWINENPNK